MNNDATHEKTKTENDRFGEEVTIKILRHGRSDQLRVSICSYQSAPFVNLRVWFQRSDHQFRPTKTGITFHPGRLDEIIAALEETKRRLAQSVADRSASMVASRDGADVEV